MAVKNLVFGRKVVTPIGMRTEKTELPKISDRVLDIIRDAKVESLQGLLGPNRNDVMLRLVDEYWKNR